MDGGHVVSMISVPCILCQKTASFPAVADRATRTAYLIEHVRTDFSYAPFYCGHPTCVGSWASQRLFDRHHQWKHADQDKLVFNQNDALLASEINRITGLVFPGALESPEGVSEQLSDYVNSEDAKMFIREIHRWDRTIHRQFLFKNAYGDSSENDNSGEDIEAEQLFKRPKMELVEGPASFGELILIEDSSSPVEESGGRPVTEASPSHEQPASASIEQTSVERLVPKRHIYANYGRSRGIGSRPCGTLRRRKKNESGEHATAPKTGANKMETSASKKIASPKKTNWASFERRWGRGRGGAASRVPNTSRAANPSGSTLESILGDGSNADASDGVPTVKSILQEAIGPPARDNRPRRPCALCGIRLLKVSERKHVESHLQKLGEFRFECLKCGFKTIFDDTAKVWYRHPKKHNIRKAIEGVHFRDYTVEHGLDEKRRIMHAKCFPPVTKRGQQEKVQQQGSQSMTPQSPGASSERSVQL